MKKREAERAALQWCNMAISLANELALGSQADTGPLQPMESHPQGQYSQQLSLARVLFNRSILKRAKRLVLHVGPALLQDPACKRVFPQSATEVAEQAQHAVNGTGGHINSGALYPPRLRHRPAFQHDGGPTGDVPDIYENFGGKDVWFQFSGLEAEQDAPTRGAWVPLVASRLALPPPGLAASTPILDILPSAIKRFYSSPELLLRNPPPPLHEVAKEQAKMRIPAPDDPEWQRVVGRLTECTMASLWPLSREVKCINGAFAVAKDADHDRFIINMRPGNLYLNNPAIVALTNPADLAMIRIPKGETVYTAKADVKNMFHMLGIMDFLQPYLALPPVIIDGTKYNVVLRSLPMGCSHSVSIAMHCLQFCLRFSYFHSFPKVGDLPVISRKPLETMLTSTYVDDMAAIGIDP